MAHILIVNMLSAEVEIHSNNNSLNEYVAAVQKVSADKASMISLHCFIDFLLTDRIKLLWSLLSLYHLMMVIYKKILFLCIKALKQDKRQ